ncbi:MAG: hypothetical protein J6V32_00980 [Elusimicrobiaceae bacterium]|nr:hypothetical protein [Elusimicrobiaceae bacterium]
MERLLEIIGIVVGMYVIYALTMGKWNYTSQAQREHRKTELKEAGLSVRFYFMHPRTQFVLTLASGGIFTLYWLYKQWSRVLRGFKRLDGTPLSGSAWGRALGGWWSFFALGNLINRTCEYMQKETSWPSWLWGSVWLSGLGLVFVPVEMEYRLAGFVIFCFVPTVLQRRINTLTAEHIPAFPRAVEIVVMLLGAVCVVGCVMAWHQFLGR